MATNLKNFKLDVAIPLEWQKEWSICGNVGYYEEFFLNASQNAETNETRQEYTRAYELMLWAKKCNVDDEMDLSEAEINNGERYLYFFCFSFKKFEDMCNFVKFYNENVSVFED